MTHFQVRKEADCIVRIRVVHESFAVDEHPEGTGLTGWRGGAGPLSVVFAAVPSAIEACCLLILLQHSLVTMEQRDHPSILIQYFKAMISHPQVSPVWPGSSKTNPQQISLSRAQLELSAGITEEVAVSQQTLWSRLLSRSPLKGALICDTPLQFKLSCEPSRAARHISVDTLQKMNPEVPKAARHQTI